MNNQQDRRLLYEVTGMRGLDDQHNDESSDGSTEEEDDPSMMDFAFMYQGPDNDIDPG